MEDAAEILFRSAVANPEAAQALFLNVREAVNQAEPTNLRADLTLTGSANLLFVSQGDFAQRNSVDAFATVETWGSWQFTDGTDTYIAGNDDNAAGIKILSVTIGSANVKVGFNGVTAIARPSAYTLTFPTISGGGSQKLPLPVTGLSNTAFALIPANGVFTDVGATNTGDRSLEINGNFSDFIEQYNLVKADLAAVGKLIQKVVYDLASYGLLNLTYGGDARGQV